MAVVDQRQAFVRPLVPHLVWEGVLFVVLLLLIGIARGAQPAFFGNDTFWVQWAIVGLMTSAVALSLRMATPNLAAPAMATAGGFWFVDRVNEGSSATVAAIVAIVLCLVVGLVLGAFVGLTGVPAWAASLGVFALLQAWLIANTENGVTPMRGGGLAPSVTWFVLFALMSVLAAVALASPALRARLMQTGSVGMSSRLVTALVGLGGSSAVAGLAGVLLARRASAVTGVVSMDLLLLALGAALIAGVSVYGGQGPIFGVLLGSGIAAVLVHWNVLAGRATWSQLVVAGVLILLGLLVGWVIALISRRTPA